MKELAVVHIHASVSRTRFRFVHPCRMCLTLYGVRTQSSVSFVGTESESGRADASGGYGNA
jgi:hypothetical protein